MQKLMHYWLQVCTKIFKRRMKWHGSMETHTPTHAHLYIYTSSRACAYGLCMDSFSHEHSEASQRRTTADTHRKSKNTENSSQWMVWHWMACTQSAFRLAALRMLDGRNGNKFNGQFICSFVFHIVKLALRSMSLTNHLFFPSWRSFRLARFPDFLHICLVWSVRSGFVLLR